MHSNRFSKTMLLLATSVGWLFGTGDVNCIPSRNQFYALINSGIINGTSTLITTVVQNIFPNVTQEQ